MSLNKPVLSFPGLGTVHVIGGAHLSKESIEAATAAVRTLNPKELLIELCHERKDMLDPRLDRPAEPLPPVHRLFTERFWTAVNPLFWAVHVPMAGFAALSDTSMGGEMRAAYLLAAQRNIPVHLIDREVSITLFRALAAGAQAVESKLTGGLGRGQEEDTAAAAAEATTTTATTTTTPTEAVDPKAEGATARSQGGWSGGAFKLGEDSEEGEGLEEEEAAAARTESAEWWALYWGMVRGASLSDDEFRALSARVQVAVKEMLDSLEARPARAAGAGGGGGGGGGVVEGNGSSGGGSFGKRKNLFGEGDVERALFRVIGDERDRVLAFQCVAAARRVGPGEKVVAVVGAAHAEGIKAECASVREERAVS